MSGLVPVAKRWWWLLAVAFVVAALSSYVFAAQLEPTYEAEAKLLVGPINTDNETLRAAGSLANTYAALATSGAVLDAVRRDLAAGGPIPSANVDAHASDVTRLLTIRASDKNPQRAAAIANTVADTLLTVTRGTVSRPEGQLQVIERAMPPANPTGPDPFLIVPLAAIAGLLSALGIAVMFEALNRTVRSGGELAELAPVAFLGSVNGVQPALGEPLVLHSKPDSRGAAAYRVLAAKIQLARGDRRPRSIVVAGAADGASTSHLAANLATALAESGATVTLLDTSGTGDVARVFELQENGEGDAAEPLKPVRSSWARFERLRVKQTPRLIIVPRLFGQPLDVEEARQAIDALLADSDVVVMPAYAVEGTPSSLLWARAADATVLLVERDRTRRDRIAPAVQSLDLVGANVIGTVLAGDRL